MKRFLSCQKIHGLTVEQLKTQLGQFGITPQQMFEQMNLPYSACMKVPSLKTVIVIQVINSELIANS